MPEELIIIGTGGNAYDLLDIVEAINAVAPTWTVRGFLDDAKPAGAEHLGLPILGRLDEARQFTGCRFINVIGSDRSFRQRPQIMASTGLAIDDFVSLAHPHACVSSRAKLGRGVQVNYGVSIGGGVVVGNHVSLGPGCTIGHDSIIEDHAMVAPGAVISGFVHIGAACYVGAGAMIRQRVDVANEALIGMGAVVLLDVPRGATVVGNPARLLVKPPTGSSLA